MAEKLRLERPSYLPKVAEFLHARCQTVAREGLCVPTLQLQEVEGYSGPYPEPFFSIQTVSAHLL